MILPFHRYTSHPVSKHKWVRKQSSCSLALTEQFFFLTFHCNCFPLIWMLKCLTGHDPTGPEWSDGKGDLTVWLECAVLTYILVINPTFLFSLQIKKIFIWHPKCLIFFILSSFALHGRFPPFYVFYPPTTLDAEQIHQMHPSWASFPRALISSSWTQRLSCSCIPRNAAQPRWDQPAKL